jgi:Domain of unknown function (DUF5658)
VNAPETKPTAQSLPHDRRILPDRWRYPTTLWSALLGHGRRSGFWRAGEGRNAYVDRPAPRIVGLALWVCLASVADAYLTLAHLQAGGHEGNPLMALALAYGDTGFCWIKIGITNVGMWVLAAHQQFPLTSKGLQGLALGYGILLLYQLVLLLWGS